MPRLLAISLTAAAVLWAATLIAVPWQAARGRWPLIVAAAQGVGALVCHQRPERSFHLSGARLPVCARCTGLYLSGAAGAIAGWFGLAGLTRRTRLLLCLAALPTAATLAVEWSGAGAPSNVARAVAALALGGTAAWLFVRMLRAESREAHAL